MHSCSAYSRFSGPLCDDDRKQMPPERLACLQNVFLNEPLVNAYWNLMKIYVGFVLCF